ncbi:hypothetical protein ACLBNB_22720 [Pseudomonas chlororaphis subsp. aurantiaca]|nr:hypothetical protein [Pseudomonas chlororaphis]
MVHGAYRVVMKGDSLRHQKKEEEAASLPMQLEFSPTQ